MRSVDPHLQVVQNRATFGSAGRFGGASAGRFGSSSAAGFGWLPEFKLDNPRWFFGNMLAGMPAGSGAPADIAGLPVLVFRFAIFMSDIDIAGVEVDHHPILLMDMHGPGFGHMLIDDGNDTNELILNRDTALGKKREGGKKQAAARLETGTQHDRQSITSPHFAASHP